MSCRFLLSVWLFFSIIPLCSIAQTRNSAYEAYIGKYKDMAVDQMHKYHVPASITLAQGLIESDAGRSMLAVEGNNHFGIKCHSDWKGRKMYYDDDRRGDCFRKYGSVQASFEDHSKFLASGSRYASLFELKLTDYKGWANGLKKAGYATNPNYAGKLIEIIELYGLDRYDGRKGSRRAGKQSPSNQISRQTYLSNGLLYVRIGYDETLKNIAREFHTSRGKLRRYNEIDRKFVPSEGSVIYLEKKKCRASKEYGTHVVGPDESLWSISQLYGVRMNCLIRKNRISQDNPLSVGMELRVR